MASEPLATVADLRSLLGADAVPLADEPQVAELLLSASAAVREAAGQQFTRATSTALLAGNEGTRLRLPQRPVVSVDQVVIEPVAAGGQPWVDDGWRLVSGELERSDGWGRNRTPTLIAVTYTHGYDPLPRPVRDLVVQLAVAGRQRAVEEGTLGSMPGVRQESISSNAYAVTYGSDEPAPVSVFDLPQRTRRWLRRAYGVGEAGMVTSR